MAALSSAFTSDKPFASEYSLACVKLPKDPDFNSEAIRYLKEDTADCKLKLNVEYRQQGLPPAVTLLTENQETDILKNLVKEGWLLVDDRKERRLQKLVSEPYLLIEYIMRSNY